MKTPLQAAHDLLHVMTEVGQAECYINDMRLIIEGLQQQYTAGLLRAAEICKSKHENMDSRLNYVAGWLDAEAAIRKEAGKWQA